MRCALAAMLVALLPACAAPAPAAPEEAPAAPILVAQHGSNTLRVVEALSTDGRRITGLRLAFESTEPDTLLARGPQAIVGPGSEPSGSRVSAPTHIQGNEVLLDVPSLDPSDVEVVLCVLRVREWRQHERAGLMDASLDEVEWPPYLLRFAGEGESFWLAATLVEPSKRDPEGISRSSEWSFSQVVEESTNSSVFLPPLWAAENMVVTDANGRVLVRHSSSVEGETALASFSTHAPGTPPPEGEPTIQYPVTVRLRVAARFATQVSWFRFRELPLAPTD